MILNGHYIYVFPTSGAHETEWYFTLSEPMTIYFALVGATLKIDDSTTLVTESTEVEATSSTYTQYVGVSHNFAAGNHKVYIDSTDPSVPYHSYTKESGPVSDVGRRVVYCLYDTRVVGGYKTNTSTGKSIFYLSHSYFTGTMTIVGKVPSYFLDPSSSYYYPGTSTTTTVYPAISGFTGTLDLTEVTKIDNYGLQYIKWAAASSIVNGYMNAVTLAGGANMLSKVEEIGNYGLSNCFTNSVTEINFDSLKTVGDVALTTNASVSRSLDWKFPVLETLGGSNLQGKGLVNNFELPNIKTLGSGCFTNRGTKANNTIDAGPAVIHLGNKITTIGGNCFMTPEDYYDYAPHWYSVFKVYIDATTPPTVSNYAFYRKRSSASYMADGNSIYVPSSRVTTYKNNSYFRNFSNYIYAQ